MIFCEIAQCKRHDLIVEEERREYEEKHVDDFMCGDILKHL